MSWWNEDPAPRWVPLVAGSLMLAMLVAVVAYGFWSYR